MPAVAQSAPPQSEFAARIEAAKESMMADSAKALSLSRQAAALASGSDLASRQDRLTAQWLEGEALIRLNRTNEARSVISAALTEVAKVAPRQKLHADLLRSSASLQAIAGEYGEALKNLLKAHESYLALGEARSQAIVLQNIGSLYSDAHDYSRVLRYYNQAKAAYPEDLSLTLSAHNNTGNALKELDRLDEAEKEFRSALAIAEKMQSPLLEARVLNNIASTQFLQGSLDAADATATRGLRISGEAADEWKPFLYGVRAQIALKRGDLQRAKALVERTFAGEDLSATSPFFRDFHEAGYDIYRQLGDYKLAVEHLAAFNRIDTQARDLSAKANNALLAAQFDSESRELRISKLSAEKAVNEANLAKAQNNVIMLTGGVGLLILLIVATLLTLRTVNRSRAAISAANDKLLYVAQHDDLTGLFAREHFRTLLEKERAKCAASDENGTLMLIDLDRFKQVNDMYGHAAGDALLVETARRFREAAGEKAVIGRLGGDEFALFLPSPIDFGESKKIAAKIVELVSKPYQIDDFEVEVGASIGLARIARDGDSTSALMTNADLALYAAKHRGRGTFVVFNPSMREQKDDRPSIEADLAKALERGEMSISYQPIINGASKQVVCNEALMRWNHPTRGSIPPSVFIPIAEDHKLIDRLGAWILDAACEQAALWPEDVKLAVNVSAIQLSTGGFLATVVRALSRSGLEPHRLILELTESTALEIDDQIETLLKSLADLGVQFALDDFGRGYSSLGYIEKMRFSMIKIDRDFVQAAAAGSKRGQAIVAAIVSLARSLKIEVTAEGIEQQDQFEILQHLGCSCFQGYYLGLPEPIRPGNSHSAPDSLVA